MASKIVDVKIAKGEHVHLETPGGGGWGEAHLRGPEKVARDVRLGYVSVEAALSQYRVVVAADGALDHEETMRLRQGEQA